MLRDRKRGYLQSILLACFVYMDRCFFGFVRTVQTTLIIVLQKQLTLVLMQSTASIQFFI